MPRKKVTAPAAVVTDAPESVSMGVAPKTAGKGRPSAAGSTAAAPGEEEDDDDGEADEEADEEVEADEGDDVDVEGDDAEAEEAKRQRRERRGIVSSTPQQDDAMTSVDGIDQYELAKSQVAKVARGAVPPNVKLPKDVLTAILRGSTVFISYISCGGQATAEERGKKSMNGDDVIEAFRESGFPSDLVKQLSKEVNAFKDAKGVLKTNKGRVSKAAAAAAAEEASTSASAKGAKAGAAGAKGKGKAAGGATAAGKGKGAAATAGKGKKAGAAAAASDDAKNGAGKGKKRKADEDAADAGEEGGEDDEAAAENDGEEGNEAEHDEVEDVEDEEREEKEDEGLHDDDGDEQMDE